ncbi:hemagglutinin repeat-containing protein, partial [Conchiformibius steedae]|uniref:hemagglutinin repeat-containing protein n=1 Tax=Conchiformibius steedae TaxID=153493 RepID=UPI0026F0B668
MQTHNLKLSSTGKLLVSLSLAYMGVSGAMAANIEAANSNTGVSQKGGVDIVNIATPNQHGLSHNQFNQFNVGKAGAVLNNSRQAGRSELAGDLGANANLRDQAAAVILNEVVSKNPSLILGKQEVFGMAADYVLANPNGITVKDGGFINTNRASLVVGKPELKAGRLESLGVGGNTAAKLDVQGQLGGANVLDLVAPKVVVAANADVQAVDAINMVSGNSKVALKDDGTVGVEAAKAAAATEAAPAAEAVPTVTRTRTVTKWVEETRVVRGGRVVKRRVPKKVLETYTVPAPTAAAPVRKQAAAPAPVLDGQVFGSMRAGSIRIHATNEKGTQELRGTIAAQKELKTDIAGKLDVRAAKLSGENVVLKAKDTSIDGIVTRKTDYNTHDSGTGRMVAAYRHEENGVKYQNAASSTSQSFAGSSISATNALSLENSGNINIKGAQITAGTLNVDAANLTTGGERTTNRKNSSSNKSKALWFNNSVSSDTEETLHATNIKVNETADVKVKGKVDLKATKLNVGKTLSLQGEQGIKLQGEVTRDLHSTSVDFKNETKVENVNNRKLKTGHSRKSFDLQTLHATEIEAGGDVILQSQQNLETAGAKVKAAGDLLTKVNKVHLDTVSTTDKSVVDDKLRFFGGADEGLNDLTDQTLHGSSLIAGKKVVLDSKKGVTVRGSAVKGGTEGALVNAGAGKANITHVNATDLLVNRKRIGTIFNITKKLEASQSSEQTAVGATLNSDADLIVKSESEINVLGSQILAARDIELKPTNGNVNIAAAKTNSHRQTESFGIKPFARTDANKGQLLDANAKVGVGVSFIKAKEDSKLTQHAGSNVQAGGNLTVASKKDVNVHGSTIGAKENVKVAAQNINVTAAKDTNSTVASQRVTEIGIGASVSANNGTPKVTLSAGITSGKTTTDSNATTAKVSGVNGGNIKLVAENTIKHEGTNIKASGSVNQAAKQITNSAAVNTVDATTVEHKGGITLEVGASTNKVLSAKATVGGSGGKTVSNTTTAAGGNVQAGGNVNLIAKDGKVTDVGTKYNANGTLTVEAKDYVNEAAVSTSKHVSNKGGAELSLGASTTDFATINLSVGGKVGYNHEKGNATQATKGTLNAENVVVNADNKATIAADIAAQNDVKINAKNGVTFTESKDTVNNVSGGFELGGSVGVKVVPAAGVVVPNSVGVNANVNYGKKDYSKATGSNVQAGNDVIVDGGKKVELQGTNVAAKHDVSIKGNQVVSNSALTTNDEVGVGVGANVALGLGDNVDPIKSFDVGVDVDVKRGKEHTHAINTIQAGNEVSIAGNFQGAGVQMTGTDVAGNKVNISNANPNGTVSMTGVNSSYSNLTVGVGVNVGGELEIEKWTEREIRTWLNRCGYPQVSVTDKEMIRKIWNLHGGGRFYIDNKVGGGGGGGKITYTPPTPDPKPTPKP